MQPFNNQRGPRRLSSELVYHLPSTTKQINNRLNNLRHFYNKTVTIEQQTEFLRGCRQDKRIPECCQLQFQLTQGCNNEVLVNNIVQILNQASSRILDQLISEQESLIINKKSNFESYKCELFKDFGKNAKHLIREAEVIEKPKLIHSKHKLAEKRRNLSNVKTTANTLRKYVGSRKVKSSSYSDPKNDNFIKTVRLSRKNRSKYKKAHKKYKNKSEKFVLSDEDRNRLNPENLTDNVLLTEVDMSVLRLSDKFAMTPRQPLDVSDMTVGTHRWAESIRWTVFWFKWRQGKTKNKAGYEDLCERDRDEFEKKPWYTKTGRAAPQADPETENFIAECQAQFLDPANRRRIKGNLSKEEWNSLYKLRNLPLTHNAACRFADKSSKTIITNLDNDDRLIKNDLDDSFYYSKIDVDPTETIKEKIITWSKKWTTEQSGLSEDISMYITNIDETSPGNVKPLYKTHKEKPWPIRLLLSGTNTPVQPLSKFVQCNIKHLTSYLPYQVIDTKDFLQKIIKINTTLGPLPATTRVVICDVVKLYPSVNNTMGVPAVCEMLTKYPSSSAPSECIIEALKICLDNNVCQYTSGDGQIYLRIPCRGTAMGPSHACDYVDVCMGKVDHDIVAESPVPLPSTLQPVTSRQNTSLDWSRFRDDGITFLLHEDHVLPFTRHLQCVHPDLKWEISAGQSMHYLNLTVSIVDGYIQTDEYSKSSHNYLPPHSCHPPSTFKGLITSKGVQLRMNCSKSSLLKPRLHEYAGYFAACGWPYAKAYNELVKGAQYEKNESEEEASQKRLELINKPRGKKPKKLVWLSKWDPRAPSKSEIIRKNLHLLYRNPENKQIFHSDSIIAANRRRPNLGEFIKPTVPRRLVQHGPHEENGSFPCVGKEIEPRKKGACDLCKHIDILHNIKSPWDGRTWKIRGHNSCGLKNLIYLICCQHENHWESSWYVGSAVDIKSRWRNHRADFIGQKTNKCGLASHSVLSHPEVLKTQPISFLKVVLLESVKNESDLLTRELWWQNNLGTVFVGLNKRKDTRTVSNQTKRVIF